MTTALAAADPTAMEAEASSLLARVRGHQAAAERISDLAAACGGAPPAWDALAEVAADVELKAALWRGLREWGEAGAAWLASKLFGVDVGAMEDTVRARGGARAVLLAVGGACAPSGWVG